MSTRLLATTAALAIAASAAMSQSAADQIVAQLQGQGFTRIEIKEGPTQIKVEAIRGSTKVEYIYDARTGALLSSETSRVRAGDDTRPGIEVDRDRDDFIDDDDEEGDDEEDDDEEGSDEEDDDEEGDDEEDDDEEDDEEDDDEEGDDEENDEEDDDEEDDE